MRKRKFRYWVIVGIFVAIWVGIIATAVIVAIINAPRPTQPYCVPLTYAGQDENGDYLIKITDANPPSSKEDLTEYYIVIYDEKGNICSFPDQNINFYQAKLNYINPSYIGNITYRDTDGNNKTSDADIIKVKSIANGGVGKTDCSVNVFYGSTSWILGKCVLP